VTQGQIFAVSWLTALPVALLTVGLLVQGQKIKKLQRALDELLGAVNPTKEAEATSEERAGKGSRQSARHRSDSAHRGGGAVQAGQDDPGVLRLRE